MQYIGLVKSKVEDYLRELSDKELKSSLAVLVNPLMQISTWLAMIGSVALILRCFPNIERR